MVGVGYDMSLGAFPAGTSIRTTVKAAETAYRAEANEENRCKTLRLLKRLATEIERFERTIEIQVPKLHAKNNKNKFDSRATVSMLPHRSAVV